MRASALSLTIAGLICVAGPAQAQHEAGDWSLSGSGSINFFDAGFDTIGIGTVNVSIGKFVASNSEVGALGAISIVTSDGDTSVTGNVGGTFRQYFGSGRTRFYTGLLGVTDITSDITDRPFWFRGAAGVRIYANRNSSFFVEANYGMVFQAGESNWDPFPALAFGFAAVF